jgi:signal transduction histidine kinase/CheY-like chemotaxis protein/HAMP domain-containing protein
MQAHFPAKRFPFNLDLVLRRGVGRTLLLSFLALAMIPMALVSAISYHLAANHLVQEVRRNIAITAELKSRQLQAFFDEETSAADSQAPQPATTAFSAPLNQILKMPADMGPGAHAYLVDANRRLLVGSIGAHGFSEKSTIDTDQTRKWRERLTVGNAGRSLPAPFAYTGPDGSLVIGTHAAVRLGDTPYALIVEVDRQAAFTLLNRFRGIVVTAVLLVGVGVLVVATGLARAVVGPVRELSQNASMVAEGDLDDGIRVTANNEIGELAAAFNGMIHHFKAIKAENDTQARFISGLARLHRLIGGEQKPEDLCLNTLEFFFDFLALHQADFYILNGEGGLQCIGRLPGQPDARRRQIVHPGGGRVDQAALEKTILAFRKEPQSGLTAPVPATDTAHLIAVPLVMQQTVKGVLELEKTDGFSRFDLRFLHAVAEILAVALNTALTRQQEKNLLERTREHNQQLQVREAELAVNTRELSAQRQVFQTSEQTLQLKQLELEAANAQMVKSASDLEAHMSILERQKRDMEIQNTELEKTHRALEDKARQLEVSSRYKTEFMANMSHELRTPLNSILLLSRLLLENKEKTLTDKQSEFARTIHSAGDDLLNLINEILDLARVESGKMEVVLETVRIQSIVRAMQECFTPLAEQSGIAFTIHVAPNVPDQLLTDRKRIQQIINNFLSNAFKFTPMGTIRLEIKTSPDLPADEDSEGNPNTRALAISVVDTGIGIPADKHQMVFEAFQQVDGSTRRKYGGTGLGLSISRELARMLGGEITLESEAGQGSRFTLHLPLAPLRDKTPAALPTGALPPTIARPIEVAPQADKPETPTGGGPVPDDRRRLSPGEKSILIIDAGAGTIEPIRDVAHRKDYKVLVAEQVQTGLHFADYYLPTAIFANLRLPGADGWTMIRRLKANPETRHTPVFTVSPEEDHLAASVHGAAGHVVEPITASGLDTAFHRMERLRSIKDRTVLALAPDQERLARIVEAVGGGPIEMISAATAAEAKAALDSHAVHAVVVHAAMGEIDQRRFIHAMQHPSLPVILFSDRVLNAFPHDGIRQYADRANISVVDTPDQLLLSLILCLHLMPEALNDDHRDRLRAMDARQSMMKGRKVLLVDDDMRTVFAVTNVLEDQGAEVLTGKTGKESLDKLDAFPDIDLILMDVMIAEVDGYRAIREIRNQDRYRTLPIIALTAKAMKGDRSKCISAGADDYLAKPVNLDKLKSMLKIWLDPQLAAPRTIGR